MLRITNLKLNLDDAIDYASEISNLRKLVISRYNIQSKNLLLLRIFKKAIDARRKNNIHFVYSVDIELADEKSILNKKYKNLVISPNLKYRNVAKGSQDIFNPPVIVGFGPSGIFSALLLSRRGYNPIVLERGFDIVKRTKEWNDFLETRKFNEQSSI
ncbi:MAG: hypothetical protein PQJ44_09840, partial [Sphaerochaetaceae bacterium]|nr:hypothetical protein [Sphaerochaetaceae bacterium]